MFSARPDKYTRALQREAASYTGIYILLGEDESGQRAYIGEGENIANRLREPRRQQRLVGSRNSGYLNRE